MLRCLISHQFADGGNAQRRLAEGAACLVQFDITDNLKKCAPGSLFDQCAEMGSTIVKMSGSITQRCGLIIVVDVVQNLRHGIACGIFGQDRFDLIFMAAQKLGPEQNQHGVEKRIAVFLVPQIFNKKIFHRTDDCLVISGMENQKVPLCLVKQYMRKKLCQRTVRRQNLEKGGFKRSAADQNIDCDTVIKNTNAVFRVRRNDADIPGSQRMRDPLNCSVCRAVINAQNFKKFMV